MALPSLSSIELYFLLPPSFYTPEVFQDSPDLLRRKFQGGCAQRWVGMHSSH